jgi:hypothetical protein
VQSAGSVDDDQPRTLGVDRACMHGRRQDPLTGAVAGAQIAERDVGATTEHDQALALGHRADRRLADPDPGVDRAAPEVEHDRRAATRTLELKQHRAAIEHHRAADNGRRGEITRQRDRAGAAEHEHPAAVLRHAAPADQHAAVAPTRAELLDHLLAYVHCAISLDQRGAHADPGRGEPDVLAQRAEPQCGLERVAGGIEPAQRVLAAVLDHDPGLALDQRDRVHVGVAHHHVTIREPHRLTVGNEHTSTVVGHRHHDVWIPHGWPVRDRLTPTIDHGCRVAMYIWFVPDVPYIRQLSAESHDARSDPSVLSSSTSIGVENPSLMKLRCDVQISRLPFVPVATRVDEK